MNQIQWTDEYSAQLAAMTVAAYDSFAIGVGDGAAPFSPSQRGLTGDQVTIIPCDEGFPRWANGVLEFRATVGDDGANHELREQAIFGIRADGTPKMITRIPIDRGTKRGGVWTFTYSLRF